MLPALGQEFLVWTAKPSRVLADDDFTLETSDQVDIFVVHEDHLRAGMVEDVFDLSFRQSRVD